MGADLEKVLPVFNGEGSDSAMLDNMLEFISMNGRSLIRAVSMLLPEPWDKNEVLTTKRSALGSVPVDAHRGVGGPCRNRVF